jgi:predicted O-methyltransferase YrrM
MSDYLNKINNFMIHEAYKFKKPRILEFGVRNGVSTKLFLEVCKKNNGSLISIDINDHSKLFRDKKWKFIKSRDDNFKYLDKKLPKNFDIIFLDTLHEAKHVEKIFYHYYRKLKIGGEFYIDDISWLPYIKNSLRDNSYCELNNYESFNTLLEIYNNNIRNFEIYFSFNYSGICKIIKKKNHLLTKRKINIRKKTLKNLIRDFLKFLK